MLGDCRSEGAARPTRIAPTEWRTLEEGVPGRFDQDIDKRVISEVAAFDEDGATPGLEELCSGAGRLSTVTHVESGEDLGLDRVRREQRSEREEPVTHRRDEPGPGQCSAGACGQHRVQDIGELTPMEGMPDRLHGIHRTECSALDRLDRESA